MGKVGDITNKIINNAICADPSTFEHVDFPSDQYVTDVTKKNQICLHHTVSGRGVRGDINTWLNDKKRIATHFIIGWDGKIYQCFGEKFWGFHLGIKKELFNKFDLPYQVLDKGCIGIEIDSYGGITKKGEKYYTAYNTEIESDRVVKVENGYRSYDYFEKYTEKQILSLQRLLIYLGEKHNINLSYDERMWHVNKAALSGGSGIWSHTSFRLDKSDVFPQDELIKMLKCLK